VTPRLGYYVHHHGRGHLHRALALLPQLRTPATILTSLDVADPAGSADVVRLPLDVPSGERVPDVAGRLPLPPVLHHAPIGVAGLRHRTAAMASWFATADPAVLVVDVSVEVTLLARLSGVAPVVVRQHGDRRDPAHRAAYEGSAALLAPWTPPFEDPTTPREVRDRTWYVGGVTRSSAWRLDRDEARRRAQLGADQPVVVVLAGAGGSEVGLGDIAEAARSTPAWRWTVIGLDPAPGDAVPPGLDVRGWVDDPGVFLRGADVAVIHAGHNAVTEAGAAGARTVVVPAARPFAEQAHKARRLAALGVAVVAPTWPAGHRWPALLSRAEALDPTGLAELVDDGGARRAASHLDGLVAELTA
jgi:UDP-N-acetylglucosamine--N-acetylmuramyl-(pentapeptide) pyrophosphoryl-undecaprenol N-acetylglucosamine transferase